MDRFNLAPPKGSRKKRKRVGRGEASGWGKTSGRGTKGQKSRSGGGTRPVFEGGQMPLQRRLPKRGFTNKFRKEVDAVNVGSLNIFSPGEEVTPEVLRFRRLARGNRPVKLLAKGELRHALRVTVHAASRAAKEAVEGLGGAVTIEAFLPKSHPRPRKLAE